MVNKANGTRANDHRANGIGADVVAPRIEDKLASERQLQKTQQDFECVYTQMPWQQMEAGWLKIVSK